MREKIPTIFPSLIGLLKKFDLLVFLFCPMPEHEHEEKAEKIKEEKKEADAKRLEPKLKRPPYVPKCYGNTKGCLRGMEDCSALNCIRCEEEDEGCDPSSPAQVCKNKADGTGERSFPINLKLD